MKKCENELVERIINLLKDYKFYKKLLSEMEKDFKKKPLMYRHERVFQSNPSSAKVK